jgi:hypothetical protein
MLQQRMLDFVHVRVTVLQAAFTIVVYRLYDTSLTLFD